MPNWCSNELTVQGKSAEVDAFLKEVKGEPSTDPNDKETPALSFGKIIPMPESLNVTSGSVGDDGYEAWHGSDDNVDFILSRSYLKEANVRTREELQQYLLKKDPEYKRLGDIYAENLRQYGHTTWYDWCIQHWGTKWDACHSRVIRDNKAARRSVAIKFSTAWGPPSPVIVAMIRKFPKLSFKLKYKEEGCNLRGIIAGKNGEITEG